MFELLITTFEGEPIRAIAPLVLAGIAAGAALLGGVANSVMNRHAQRESNRQNYRMFQEENAYNTEMWEKTNAYNTPAAQLQRLQAAGLNPLLHSVDGGNASMQASATAQPVQPTPFDMSFIGDAAQAGVNTYQQAQDLRSQQQLRAEQTAKTISETIGQNLDNMGKIVENEYKPREKAAALENIKKTNESLMATTAATRQGITESQQRVANAKKQLEVMAKELEIKDAEKQKIFADIDNNRRLTDANVNKLAASAALDIANCGVAAAQEGLLNEQQFGYQLDNYIKGYAQSAFKNIPFEQLNVLRRQAYLLYEQGYNEVVKGDNIREATYKMQREIQNMDLTDSERVLLTGFMNTLSLGTAGQSANPQVNGYGAGMISNPQPWYKGFTTP